MPWKHVGDVGTSSVQVDQDAGKVVISHNGMVFLFSVMHAAHLAILIDEAIALAKGEGAKLDKDVD